MVEKEITFPSYIERRFEVYREKLGEENIIGFLAPMFNLEEVYDSLSEEQKAELTERVMGASMERLRLMKIEGRESSEFYGFCAGSVANYLATVAMSFQDPRAYRTHICGNLGILLGETKHPLVDGQLKGCMDIINDPEGWKILREARAEGESQ